MVMVGCLGNGSCVCVCGFFWIFCVLLFVLVICLVWWSWLVLNSGVVFSWFVGLIVGGFGFLLLWLLLGLFVGNV